MNPPRLSYSASCHLLGRFGKGGEIPSIPDRTPQHDSAGSWGVNFFREQVRDKDFSNLTLPRTYFGRSEVRGVRFRNTDLSQSNLCWNDFLDVDFSQAILEACDLRASLFERVTFIEADLRRADLRRSRFKACSFDGAKVQGAILARVQRAQITLSKEQGISVDWRDDEGPEPDGG